MGERKVSYMGLGLIALGLVLLEGIILTVNAVSLMPQYVAIVIIIIGLLKIKRKKPMP